MRRSIGCKTPRDQHCVGDTAFPWVKPTFAGQILETHLLLGKRQTACLSHTHTPRGKFPAKSMPICIFSQYQLGSSSRTRSDRSDLRIFIPAASQFETRKSPTGDRRTDGRLGRFAQQFRSTRFHHYCSTSEMVSPDLRQTGTPRPRIRIPAGRSGRVVCVIQSRTPAHPG